MSGAAASALEAVLEGWCAKSRCDNCTEEIVISQCQGEENDAQSFLLSFLKLCLYQTNSTGMLLTVFQQIRCADSLSQSTSCAASKNIHHIHVSAAPQLHREAVYGLMYLI